MVKTEHLAVVSERMEGVWLKLNTDNCSMFRESVWLKLNIEQLSVRGWRVCG